MLHWMNPFSDDFQGDDGEGTDGVHTQTIKRSRDWPAVRLRHLKMQPCCQICGGVTNLEVHHITPVSAFGGKALELEPSNLITLCDGSRFSFSCHLVFGHHGHWKRHNPHIKVDAFIWSKKFQNK